LGIDKVSKGYYIEVSIDENPLLGGGRIKEVSEMAVEKVGEKYRCNICGNEVAVTKVGGGTLIRCGEDMEKVDSE